MTNDKKLNSEFKVRCSTEEKELLKKSAEEAGISMSDFIRSLIFTKKKLVILSEGTEIAKSLFLIHKDLEYFRNNGGVPTESLKALSGALDDVATKLNELATHLTDIHADSEEDVNE